MPRHEMINGVVVPFTAEQEAARDIEEAKHLADLTDPALLAQAAINKLEASITPRRMREAFTDPTWVAAVEAKIAIERAKL